MQQQDVKNFEMAPLDLEKLHKKEQPKQPVQNRLRLFFSRLKFRVASVKMLHQTRSNMYKNMMPYSFYLVNDQATYLDSTKINKDFRVRQSNSIIMKFLNSTRQKTINLHQDCQGVCHKIGQTGLIKCLKHAWKKIPIIPPQSIFKIIWDIFLLFFIILYLLLVPIHISFNVSFQELISPTMQQIGPAIFLLDIVIQLNTGHFDKGIPIYNKWMIIKHYLKNNLLTDIVAIIPNITYHYFTFNMEPSYLNNQSETSFGHLIRFTLLLFYLKLKRFKDIIRRLEEITHLSINSLNFIQLVKLLFMIAIIAHFLACLWIYVALVERKYNLDSWLDTSKLDNESLTAKYVYALYFTIVTMITIGYGDISPKTTIEMQVSIVVMMISCGVYAYTFNEIGCIVSQLNKNKQQMSNNLQVINYYMHVKNISHSLRYQVREYLEYYWREVMDRNQDQEDKIISQLSDQLRENLHFEANKVVLKESQIFTSNFSERLIHKTVTLIKEHKFNPEQIITQQNVKDDCSIYFIEKGSVEIFYLRHVPGKPDQFFSIQTLRKGQYFNSDSFFTSNASTFSVRSLEFTTLLSIQRNDFINLLHDFPEDYEQFCAIKDSILLYTNYEQVEMFCQICNSYKHTVEYCPMIHYSPNRLQIIKQYNKINSNVKRAKTNRSEYQPKVKFRTLQNNAHIYNCAFDYNEENEELIEEYMQIYLESQQKKWGNYEEDNNNKEEVQQSFTVKRNTHQQTGANSPRLSKELPLMNNIQQSIFGRRRSQCFTKPQLLSQQSIVTRNNKSLLDKIEHVVQKMQDLEINGHAKTKNFFQQSQVNEFQRNFENQKNFSTYFPYNNLMYQVQIMKLNKQDRKFLNSRIHLDNILHIRKNYLQKAAFYHEFMKAMIEKNQLEEQQRQEAASKLQLLSSRLNQTSKLNGGGAATLSNISMLNSQLNRAQRLARSSNLIQIVKNTSQIFNFQQNSNTKKNDLTQFQSVSQPFQKPQNQLPIVSEVGPAKSMQKKEEENQRQSQSLQILNLSLEYLDNNQMDGPSPNQDFEDDYQAKQTNHKLFDQNQHCQGQFQDKQSQSDQPSPISRKKQF